MRTLVWSFVVAACAAACAPDGVAPPDTTQHFDGTGTLVAIEDGKLLIDHEEIPGFMDAMTMTFPLEDPALLEGLEPGVRVAFRVAVRGSSYAIDQIETR